MSRFGKGIIVARGFHSVVNLHFYLFIFFFFFMDERVSKT